MSVCGNALVKRRQICPRRIRAVSNRGETSALDHHATVTPIAMIAVPAITGYFGNSVHFGARRTMLQYASVPNGTSDCLGGVAAKRCGPSDFAPKTKKGAAV